jgi:lipoprotein-anchoring transpeptidase ErfK/SrfK
VVFRARVGVGQPQWPTPRGQFYIRAKLKGYGAAGSFYGPLAFITSATSAQLTDWPGGGLVGVHGTSLPGLIPGKISHGCVRMRNADILKLEKLMPVGTPLTVT